MFTVDVLINPEELSLDPSEQVFINTFNQVMNTWEEVVMGIKPFLADQSFDSFTE